jgi:hypothetical protein
VDALGNRPPRPCRRIPSERWAKRLLLLLRLRRSWASETEAAYARLALTLNGSSLLGECRHGIGFGARWDQEFAEPVALSSTAPANFPLPRTAARCGFGLLALRARRKNDSRPQCAVSQVPLCAATSQFAALSRSDSALGPGVQSTEDRRPAERSAHAGRPACQTQAKWRSTWPLARRDASAATNERPPPERRQQPLATVGGPLSQKNAAHFQL